jgi:hypothetical protein
MSVTMVRSGRRVGARAVPGQGARSDPWNIGLRGVPAHRRRAGRQSTSTSRRLPALVPDEPAVVRWLADTVAWIGSESRLSG